MTRHHPLWSTWLLGIGGTKRPADASTSPLQAFRR